MELIAAILFAAHRLGSRPSPLMGEGLGGGDVKKARGFSGDITPPQPLPIEGRG